MSIVSIQNQALELGLAILEKSDKEILPRFRNCSIQYKPDGSELTEADQQAEKVIRHEIEKQFPDHGIIGEEFEEKITNNSDYTWIIDPIDGTTPFSLGLPSFGTLISLLEKGQPVMGIIHLPAMQETVYAAKDSGCWFKVKDTEPSRIQVDSATDTLSNAFLSSSGVHNSDIHNHPNKTPFQLSPIIKGSKKFRFLGDCTQHALVCRGKIHGAIDTIMKPWDSAAIVPCIREAGGVASAISGDEENVVFEGNLITSSNRKLHNELIGLLNF